MIVVSTNEEAANAKYEIERALFDGDNWQLFLADAPLASLSRAQFECSVEWGKLIFAWWDDERSQSWRVMAYELDRAELRLQVTRGMARETFLVTLRDVARWREIEATEPLSLGETRTIYAQMLSQLIVAQFADIRVQHLTTGSARAHSTPGRYARLRLKLGTETILCLGVNEAEAQAEIDGVVAAGLIWLTTFNESHEGKKRARRLWFCLPKGNSGTAGQTVLERLTLLDTSHLGARTECFEVDERRETMTPMLPVAQQELLSAHPREARWPGTTATSEQWRGRIVRLATDQIEIRQRADRDGESFLLNGLEFARVTGREHPRIKFGVAGLPSENEREGLTTLTEVNFSDLERLVRELVTYRRADAPDHRHPLYRLRAEAWLESLLRRDLRSLDATLDDRFVYSQIPTWRGEERSVIDLLAVTHEGRLVVIEIKASEDVQLPLQGVDYWLRVEQARLRGEFTQRGLFPNVRLADQPPLLYLVAPRLRFHRAFTAVARCLSPQIEAWQIGLNTTWRAGVRVHSRERANKPH